MNIDFTGKVGLVTGGGGAIGRAAALELAKAGAKVAVVDVMLDAAAETARLITASGGAATFITADVSKVEDVRSYVQQTLGAYDRIDVFINNAGWEGIVKSTVDYPEDIFDKVIGINLRGVFLGMKYVLPVMIKQRSGAVINTASRAGLRGSRGLIAYAASKHAVLGMTKVAAIEVAAHGIRVNAVCPGSVNTRMMRSLEEQLSPGAAEQVRAILASAAPDGRYAEPEEVANLMLYLASDLASHIVGEHVIIDGGTIQG